mmetsp:Transcript_1446/g.2677  ORF Transcript_1446/g.2677 Transcript_1446/m.2677 type:complete len:261 (-) Transcript_1446:383-1165(-)
MHGAASERRASLAHSPNALLRRCVLHQHPRQRVPVRGAEVRILPGADPGQMRQDDPSDAVGVAHHEQDVQASGLRCRADSHAWVLCVPAHGGSGNQTSQRQPRPERERRRVRFRGGGGAPADSSRVRRLRKHLPGQVVRRVPDVLLCHDLPRHGRLVPAISNRADSEVRAGALYQLCIQTFRDCHGYPGACLSGDHVPAADIIHHPRVWSPPLCDGANNATVPLDSDIVCAFLAHYHDWASSWNCHGVWRAVLQGFAEEI